MAADALCHGRTQLQRTAGAGKRSTAVHTVVSCVCLNRSTCNGQCISGFDTLAAGIFRSSCVCVGVCGCFCIGCGCGGCNSRSGFCWLRTSCIIRLFHGCSPIRTITALWWCLSVKWRLSVIESATEATASKRLVVRGADCNFTRCCDIQRTAVNVAVCFCLNAVSFGGNVECTAADGNPTLFRVICFCCL